jgi:hypothetical protein
MLFLLFLTWNGRMKGLQGMGFGHEQPADKLYTSSEEKQRRSRRMDLR